MAAEINEITESYYLVPVDLAERLEHILTDLHGAVQELHRQGKLIDKHDALLEEFRPLLDQFRSPAATYLTRRAQKRNGNG
jgi:hypothetical protein